VGTLDPGFGEVSDLSDDRIIGTVNCSRADFLVVALGAKKGQLWLLRNHRRLTIPIRAHLGAAINFQAGIVKRAPPTVRACGLEWLWRIKEEHHLWTRYQHDGLVLLRLLITRVLPLAILSRWDQLRGLRGPQDFLIELDCQDHAIKISLCGFASEVHVAEAILCFDRALAFNRDIVIDLSNARAIDARFLGLLIMLRKELRKRDARLLFTGLTPALSEFSGSMSLGTCCLQSKREP